MAPAQAKLTKLICHTPAALGAAAFVIVSSARAQNVPSYLPPEMLQRTLKPDRSLVQFGMFDLNPHVGGSAVYDDNIGLRSKDQHPEEDLIFVLSPGFDLLKAGDRGADESITTLRATYNPAFIFFTKHDTNNAIDHFAAIDGGITLAKLSATLSQDFSESSGGVVDVGSRVQQRYYRTAARVRYDATEKTAFEISGSYRINDYEQLIDSTEWTEDNAVHYAITPKVSLGFGISVGQLTVSRTPERLFRSGTNSTPGGSIGALRKQNEGGVQTYVTPGLRASYRTTEKTDVALAAGGELRFFEDGSSNFGPVFSLIGTYRPSDSTDLSLEAHRREQNSAVLGGQNYISSGFGVRVGQRFRERYRASVSFTYDNLEYESAKSGVSANRADDYFLLRYGMDMILATSWTLGVFHQYRANSSTSSYDFENHQISMQTVWSY
jgi:hypothetical protein